MSALVTNDIVADSAKGTKDAVFDVETYFEMVSGPAIRMVTNSSFLSGGFPSAS